MIIVKSFKGFIKNIKWKLQSNDVDNLLWIINIVPTFAGFSLARDKVFAPFWIFHLFLLFYVYGVGNLVYQVLYAEVAGDFIKSYVNVTLLILIANTSYWWLMKRSLVKMVLKKIKQNDELAKSSQSPAFRQKHAKMLSVIKRIILIFYGFNYFDEFFIYLPRRADVENQFSMTPCVGLEPLNVSPNREICQIILGAQELTISTVVLNYQCLLLFFIAHTAAMFEMLADEMLAFNSEDITNSQIKERLPFLICRHTMILDIVDNIKSLYSLPIGLNFGINAVCICLFFYLPIEETLGFIPILVYCFLVFFLYCFLCQRLINAAEVFERAVYGCGWENFELEEQKTVYVMLMQSQKKVELLAADIVPVNIYTFASTLQGMFKFVTVVKF